MIDTAAALTAARQPVGINRCDGCSGCRLDVTAYFAEQRTKLLMRPAPQHTQGRLRKKLDDIDPPRLMIVQGRNRLCRVSVKTTGEDVTNGYVCECGESFRVREFGRKNARAMREMCRATEA